MFPWYYNNNMNNSLRKLKQKDCPLCVDTIYVDGKGKKHILFTICDVHLKMGEEENAKDFGSSQENH